MCKREGETEKDKRQREANSERYHTETIQRPDRDQTETQGQRSDRYTYMRVPICDSLFHTLRAHLPAAGFLFLGYHTKAYWWQAVVMVRQASMAFIAAAFANNPRLQVQLASKSISTSSSPQLTWMFESCRAVCVANTQLNSFSSHVWTVMVIFVVAILHARAMPFYSMT